MSPCIQNGRPSGPLARRWLALAGLAVLALGSTVYMLRPVATTVRSPITSLAVLPLNNLSGDPTQDYFADGMTEALIGNLAPISALRVVSRTSVMRFKGTRTSSSGDCAGAEGGRGHRRFRAADARPRED